jgi:hemerythrin-like domain-containing protein
MKPTERLSAEHNIVKEMLKIIGKVTLKLEAGERADSEHLDEIAAFLNVFVDKYHHGKEEDALFPALEEVGIPRDSGLVDALLTDHELGRAWVAGMVEGIESYKQGQVTAAPKIIENARHYIALLGEHMKAEEYGLYAMANTVISEERQDELLEEFERIESERIGTGKHEYLHEVVSRLKKTYGITDEAQLGGI